MSLLLRGIIRSTLRSSRGLSSLRMSSFSVSKDEPMQEQTELMTSLRSVESASAVLSLVQPNLSAMDHRQLLQALQVLFEMHKCDDPAEEGAPTTSPAFAALCRRLEARARLLDLPEVIDAVKMLTFMQVPVDAAVVQTLLQLVRHSINQLSLRQIMFVHFLLSRHAAPNPLADALRLALPLAFQIHLPLEMDRSDPAFLRDLLSYACARGLPGRAVDALSAALLRAEPRWDGPGARAVLWALSEVNCTPARHPARARLLAASCAALAAALPQLPYDDVLRALGRLRRRARALRHAEFYHEELLDAAADRARREPFSAALRVAAVLTDMAHSSTALAEHLCAAAAGGALRAAGPGDVAAFVGFLASNDYTPPGWDELAQQLAQHEMLLRPDPALPWLRLCLELAALGVFPAAPLDELYSERQLAGLLRRGSVRELLQLLTLHEAGAGAGGRALPAAVAAAARAAVPRNPESGWLCAELARALGGADLVARDVQLPNGFIADALVCLRNGYPLSLAQQYRDERTPLADLDPPSDAVVVCVKLFKESCFSANSARLRGPHRLVERALARRGVVALGVSGAAARRAPDHERPRWLLRELAARCAESGVLVSPAG